MTLAIIIGSWLNQVWTMHISCQKVPIARLSSLSVVNRNTYCDADEAEDDSGSVYRKHLVDKFYHSLDLAECYHVFHAIYCFMEQPFTSYMPEALFNMARYLTLKTLKACPRGISKVYPTLCSCSLSSKDCVRTSNLGVLICIYMCRSCVYHVMRGMNICLYYKIFQEELIYVITLQFTAFGVK